MPKPTRPTAVVLEVRSPYRLVDRTEEGPDLHVFWVERDTGAGWERMEQFGTETAARVRFDELTAPAPGGGATTQGGGGPDPVKPT